MLMGLCDCYVGEPPVHLRRNLDRRTRRIDSQKCRVLRQFPVPPVEGREVIKGLGIGSPGTDPAVRFGVVQIQVKDGVRLRQPGQQPRKEPSPGQPFRAP